jgi:membrane protein YqaA with SNARE-associated domain
MDALYPLCNSASNLSCDPCGMLASGKIGAGSYFMIESAIYWLLGILALPQIGLSAVFLVSLISATLVPLGSEPAVFAAIKASAHLFWPVILIATLGNTLGGVINYWMGYGANKAFASERKTRWFHWMERYGAKTMLLAWMPGIGDPICTLAGWLRLPFWPSVLYMAIGKFLRYVMLTSVLMTVPDTLWKQIGQWLF